LRYTLQHDTDISAVNIFYCLNDVYGASKTSDLPVMAKHNILGELNTFFQQHYATYKLLKLCVYKNASSYYKYDSQFYMENGNYFRRAMQDLKACDSICKGRGIGCTIFTMPYKSQLQQNYTDNNRPQQMVSAWCKANAVNCMDIGAYLAQRPYPEDLYLFADEIHFSKAGHKAIAMFLCGRQ
jgi:hypothetical protein